MHSCHEYREVWLTNALDGPVGCSGDQHACSECAAWQLRSGAQVSMLTSLRTLALPQTHAAPETLGAAFGDSQADAQIELADSIERYLTQLPVASAPAELAHRVGSDLAGQRAANPLTKIHKAGSPSVLDRLVDEELASPLQHQSARLMGRLDRLQAPAELDALVAANLAGVPAKSSGPRWGTWVSFLAACLVGYVAVRGASDEEQTPGRRLTIVHATSLAELSPLARGHMEALGASLDSPLSTKTGGKR